MVKQYTTEPVILRDGKLKRVPTCSGREKLDFPAPIGEREVFYILHEEPICFARSFKDKGLMHAGTRAGWGPDLLNKLEFLDGLGMLDFEPRKIGDAMVVPVHVLESGLKIEKTIPRDYGCIRLVMRGEKDG